MQVGSIYLGKYLIEYFRADESLTVLEASYHGAAWSLFIVNSIAAIIFLLLFHAAKVRDKVRTFCIKYQDRLLYGTDLGVNETDKPEGIITSVHNTWIDDWKYFVTDIEMTSDKFRGKFTGLQLPEEVVNKIFNKNAVKWYKLPI